MDEFEVCLQRLGVLGAPHGELLARGEGDGGVVEARDVAAVDEIPLVDAHEPERDELFFQHLHAREDRAVLPAVHAEALRVAQAFDVFQARDVHRDEPAAVAQFKAKKRAPLREFLFDIPRDDARKIFKKIVLAHEPERVDVEALEHAVSVAGDKHDVGRGGALRDLFPETDAVHPLHVDVQKEQTVGLLLQCRPEVGRPSEHLDLRLDAVRREHLFDGCGDDVQRGSLVVAHGDRQRLIHRHSSVACAGRPLLS